MGRWLVVIIVILLGAVSCSMRTGDEGAFSRLTADFVYGTLALSPVSATSAGYHHHENQNLDEMLDDISPAGIERQRQFYTTFRDRLAREVKSGSLSPEDRADYDIIAGQISLGLLELDRIQSYRHNPTTYVELAGNALFNPQVLEYAPKAERFRHIIARLRKFPGFLGQAAKNLADAPQIWTKVAIEENEGNIGLVDKTLRTDAPSEIRAEYDAAATQALAALREFQTFLQHDLARRTQADWRLGSELYNEKFRYTLATDLSPSDVLQRAEADLKAVRDRMLQLALPLHAKYYPAHKEHPELSGVDRENRVIGETLARIADRHSTPETYVADAKRDLEEARRFVAEKKIVTLPPRDNLQVIETPEFMRGIYAVGGFVPAPALEPQLGAFYWITPIPKSWPQSRIESKLREYNFYKLKLLTIHEAVPGHYVQLEYANDIQPKTRRILRSIFGNGPYIEGWAQYATQVLLDEGFLDHSPELRLTFQKEELRVLANAILDIRLQTLGMTDQQALDLMEKETFQESEEATAKLQRAKLSSCQLPTYLVGWRDWIRVRDQYKQSAGEKYGLTEFDDRSLKQGAVPLPVLARLLTDKPLGGSAGH